MTGAFPHYRVRRFAPIGFIRLRKIEIDGVFRHVFIDNAVPFVVARLTDQPGENVSRIERVGNARFRVLTINRQQVIF
jgi:hypothetical protein